METTPDLLVVGHITQDLQADGTVRLGGTAFYAAVTAARLGCRVAVYTSARTDLDLAPLRQAADGVSVVCQPSPANTVFRNRYRGGRREQLMLGRADPLAPEGLPAAWRSAPLVLLGPVAQEVPLALSRQFPRALVGACLQGWLRGWDRRGRVRWAPWAEAEKVLPSLGTAVLSEEDLPEEESLIRHYAARCPLLVLTRGAAGATLYQRGEPAPVAPFPVREIDPTGAGDVFAAAFMIGLAEEVPAVQAARFAAAAAALSVQGWGGQAIPHRAAVERLLQEEGDVATAA